MPPADQSKLPSTALAILGLLSFGPQSGYDLKQLADRSIRHFYWSPAKSQVYAELRRLRSLGLAEEVFVEQETRPDKRVYSITDAGREALKAWLNDQAFEPDVFKSPILMKIFFGASADPVELAGQLDAVIERDRQMVALLEESQARCEASGEKGVFTLLTVRAGLAHTRAEIQWAHEARQVLLEMNGKRRSAK